MNNKVAWPTKTRHLWLKILNTHPNSKCFACLFMPRQPFRGGKEWNVSKLVLGAELDFARRDHTDATLITPC
jgi:hypothetical protein